MRIEHGKEHAAGTAGKTNLCSTDVDDRSVGRRKVAVHGAEKRYLLQ